MDPRLVSLSKFLSLILRHEPQRIGVALDENGWISVEILLAALAAHGKSISRQTLYDVIAQNDKQRFALSEDGLRIRANQGHSVPVELQHAPCAPPAVLYHGTVGRFIAAIRREGLRKGSRHHVHLSASREVALRVGTRRGRAVILGVRAESMAAAGHTFYRTPNDVWLVDHVPPQFLIFP
jgi:putative RNA 2'-phosphotransferase